MLGCWWVCDGIKENPQTTWSGLGVALSFNSLNAFLQLNLYKRKPMTTGRLLKVSSAKSQIKISLKNFQFLNYQQLKIS
jgi:hypothetical protein